jgi:hypothetical protein
MQVFFDSWFDYDKAVPNWEDERASFGRLNHGLLGDDKKRERSF